MKRVVAALVVCGMLTTATVWAAEKAEVNWDSIKCLMASSKKANPEKSVSFEKGDVYFCCDGCKGKFEKDPKAHAAKARHQMVATKQYKQSACPLSGGDVDPEKSVKINGVSVAFCCGNCLGKVKNAEGKEQLDLVFGDKHFKKGFELVKSEE